ncbi:MAG: alkaline phosphatase [Bacteroidales bacterium]|nr:alkaline phosphatase [Bacteroidales bacterium]
MNRYAKYFLLGLALIFISAGSLSAKPKAKYVFYFIGDGMGLNEVLGASIYASQMEGIEDGYKAFSFTQFPVVTIATNRSSFSYITDSSAAGTALASGEKTGNGMIGVKSDGTTPVNSIAYYAKQAGYKVGITSNVGVNHATPGSFYGHDKSRNSYYNIGLQLPESHFDFFAGSNFLTDQKDPGKPLLPAVARKAGYTVAYGVDQYQKLKDKTSKMILFQSDSTKTDVPYRIDRKPGDLSLSQITECAVDFLSKDNNKGFFLMVEGGKIDGGGHSNDVLAAFSEVIDLSDAVEVAMDFYRKHPQETLIVVTADHETGGLAMGAAGMYELNYKVLLNRKASKDVISLKIGALRQEKNNKVSWPEIQALLQEYLGFWKEVPLNMFQEIRLMQAYQESFAPVRMGPGSQRPIVASTGEKIAAVAVSILDEMAYVSWSSGAHTGTYVPVYAIGAGSENFKGSLDNTDLPKIISQIAEYPME